MKLFVVHNARGKIVSLARPEPQQKRTDGVDVGGGLRPGRGQTILELDVEDDLARKPLGSIQDEYLVDVKAKNLVKRQKGQTARR